MGELLDELRGLQAVALKLVGIEQSLESKQRRVTGRLRLVKQAEEKLEQNKRAAQQYQIRIDQLSLEVASREEAQNRHRQALNQAKTNKEYASILAAMNTEKADTAKIEAAVLELMKEVENLNGAGAGIEAERATLLEEVERATKTLNEARAKCQPELDDLKSQRREYVDRLAPESLAMFDRAASRHEGEAMAEVVKPRSKGSEYNCGGCNMTVTLEVVNGLQSREQVQQCGSCGRILYLERAVAS
jgi:predicted  nucleic acid-binding Zn-ribbon protein